MKNLDKHDMKKMFYVENENNKTKCFGEEIAKLEYHFKR